jgi:hypothetical protein
MRLQASSQQGPNNLFYDCLPQMRTEGACELTNLVPYTIGEINRHQQIVSNYN